MSDQVSQEFNSTFAGGGGGGGGLISINGDVTPAQLLTASAGIIIGNVGPNHSVGNDGVLTVAKQGSPGRKGNIILAPSATVTITEAPAGTFTFDAIGASGIVSINGDLTPAQILAAGAGISITPGPAGTHTIAATGLGAGIISINGDAAAAQTLTPVLAGGIIIQDTGGGAHTFKATTSTIISGTQGPGAAVPANALTLYSTAICATPGTYFVFFGGGVNGIANMLLDIGLALNTVPVVASGFSGMIEVAGQTLSVVGVGQIMLLAGGDVLNVAMNHHGAGAATTSLNTFVQAFRLF